MTKTQRIREPEIYYLHDRCLVDPSMPHKSRFYAAASRNPEQTMKYGPMSKNQAAEIQRYLTRIWKKGAEAQERREEGLREAARINSSNKKHKQRDVLGTQF